MQKDKHRTGKVFGKIIRVEGISPAQLEKLLIQAKLEKDRVNVGELVSSLAIEMWRLEKRIDKIKDTILGVSDKGSNSILDQIQRIKDIFKKQEIEIREHTGTAYNDGLSLKVLHVEEVDGLPKGKMQVIETVKPSVYFKEQVIFHGEVIVGKSKEK